MKNVIKIRDVRTFIHFTNTSESNLYIRRTDTPENNFCIRAQTLTKTRAFFIFGSLNSRKKIIFGARTRRGKQEFLYSAKEHSRK